MSSRSSTGSLLTPAAARDFFVVAEPVVKAARSSEGECERNVVARARATTTNPKFNRRWKLPFGSKYRVACTTYYGQRMQADVICPTYHDLVSSCWGEATALSQTGSRAGS
jgi:hypothetical protein